MIMIKKHKTGKRRKVPQIIKVILKKPKPNIISNNKTLKAFKINNNAITMTLIISIQYSNRYSSPEELGQKERQKTPKSERKK